MMSFVLPAGLAVVVSLLAVPPTVRIARALNLLDTPDTERRLHRHAVPRLGGIAVWLAAAVGVTAAAATGSLDLLASARVAPWHGIAAGLGIMLVVGLIDDIRGVRPSDKLFAQCAAAVTAIAAGFRIDVIVLSPDVQFALGWLAAPLTLFWIVAVTNAFNLIDGLDGLAGGISLVALATIGIAAVLLGNLGMLPLVAALMGGIVGFLRYNASPARIFLGDVGSLSIGFALAVLAIEGARGPTGSVYVLVPLFALSFPLLDTAIAMLRRWLRRVPLTSADGRHVHHQLVGLGLTHRRAVALICLFAAGVAGLGLSLTFAPPVLTLALGALGTAAWVLLVVHGSRWLQYHEFMEVQASFSSGLLRARSVIRDRILARDLEARIRGASSAGEINLLLQQSRDTFGFEGMLLCSASESSAPRPVSHLPCGARVLRLDYPFRARSSDRYDDDLILRVWWREDTRTPPMYAERVVRLVAPAIEAVLLAPSALPAALRVTPLRPLDEHVATTGALAVLPTVPGLPAVPAAAGARLRRHAQARSR